MLIKILVYKPLNIEKHLTIKNRLSYIAFTCKIGNVSFSVSGVSLQTS